MGKLKEKLKPEKLSATFPAYILAYFTSEELEQKIIKYMMSIKGVICTE